MTLRARLAGLRSDRAASNGDPTPARAAGEVRPRADLRRAREAERSLRRLNRAHWRLTRGVLGDDAVPAEHDDFVVDGDQLGDAVATAKRARGLAVLGDRLAQGGACDEAQVQTVRALLATGNRTTARGLATAAEQRGDRVTGAILHGLCVADAGRDPQAWDYFAEVPLDDLARLAPVDAAHAALARGTAEAVAAARDLAGHRTSYDVPALVALAGRFLVTGHRDTATELHAEAMTRDLTTPDEDERDALANLGSWIEPASAPSTTGAAIGVLDYGQPDHERMSGNVGDYVQTLAVLGNLARFTRTTFTGPDGLDELMVDLQRRLRPELRIEEAPPVTATLVPVSRDFSAGQRLPEQVWLPAFGWHMHSLHRLGFGLPYHPHLEPVFVSFHVNDVELLTPEATDYLAAHGPIGCRDWTTVDLLLSAGVDAFFTGCITTTVDGVLPAADPAGPAPGRTALVDLRPWQRQRVAGDTEVVTHAATEHRRADLATGIRSAIELLETYRSRYARIVTSRLHCYLPATALGLDVEFLPQHGGDVRFDGLLGLAPGSDELAAMQHRIRELIADVFGRVLAGDDVGTLRTRWQEHTAPLVAAARQRRTSATMATASGFDLSAILDQIHADTTRHGPPAGGDDWVDVTFGLDRNLASVLPVAVASMMANTSAPVRLWVTARGLGAGYREWFSDQFPDVPVTFLGTDHVDYGEIGRLIAHTTIATMDRLLLPEVLPRLRRITYVDIDTVVEGDIAELAAVDLAGTPLAARTALLSGADQWRIAGRRLAPEIAAELRSTMAARHAFDFRTLNAGVLVLDLARMRADGFCRDLLPVMAGRYGLNDQDILNAYVGPDRAELDPRWNALPAYERVRTAGIVHYAGSGKPWDAELVPEGHRWRRYAADLAGRVGADPEWRGRDHLYDQGVLRHD